MKIIVIIDTYLNYFIHSNSTNNSSKVANPQYDYKMYLLLQTLYNIALKLLYEKVKQTLFLLFYNYNLLSKYQILKYHSYYQIIYIYILYHIN